MSKGFVKQRAKKFLVALRAPVRCRIAAAIAPYSGAFSAVRHLPLSTQPNRTSLRARQPGGDEGMTMIDREREVEFSDAPESENENLGPAEQVEAAIREFVRLDLTQVRRVPPAQDGSAEVATNINSLVQRVAGSSLREMQNVIWELENLRDFLQSEGERVQREISNYAQLTQAAISSTRTIADNMVPWKKVAENKRAAS
jgi:hypothetical protein